MAGVGRFGESGAGVDAGFLKMLWIMKMSLWRFDDVMMGSSWHP